ncbi:MAG: bifunctional metallophosphatase/5'-nucleotidase [Syntrophobacterales bacterium]|nr:bifunctional metallophosphatase/5'-nucleotidase [Syntrophobacterales bacterium]
MKRFGFLIVLLVLFLVPSFFPGALYGDAGLPGKEAKKLTFLFTHDLHSHFLPDIVPENGGRKKQGGYARLASLIGRERGKAAGRSILVDAGDFSMGTAFHTEFREEALELRLMGEMGYDVVALGNHDYDFRPAGLAAMLRSARAKGSRLPALVASNVAFAKDDNRDDSLQAAFGEYPVSGYNVLEINGIRIGFFAIMGRDAADDMPFAKPVSFADPVERSRAMVELLRTREKVDLVVCLSHSGTKSVKSHSEDELLPEKVPGIDVVISGHTHTTLPQPIVVGKTVIVSSGSSGAYLGALDLDISRETGVVVSSYRLEKTSAEIPEDKAIAGKIEIFKKLVDQRYFASFNFSHDQIVAETAYDMASPAYHQTRLQENGIGNMIADAFRFAVRQAEGKDYRHIDIALTTDGQIRDTFLAGKISVADVFKVLPLGLGMDGRPGYPLLSVYLTGKEIASMLEVQPTIASLKPDAYMQVAGVRFSWNPHRVPFDRVVSIAVQDENGAFVPLVADKLYRICVNAYTAGMLGFVTRASHGLIKLTPKDAAGKPVSDMKLLRIDADAEKTGVQELKEWAALTSYFQSLPDSNKDGVGELPREYRNPDRRGVSAPSWNPVRLLEGAGWITVSAVALFAFILVALAFLVRWAVRRMTKR